MNSSELKELKEKFFRGETSLDEEELLKAAVMGDNYDDPELDDLKVYFGYANDQNTGLLSDESIDKMIQKAVFSPKKSVHLLKSYYWQIAASIVIVFGIGSGIFYLNSSKVTAKDTFEDPYLAYMETKEALQKIAFVMNKGNSQVSELKKFNNEFSNLEKLSEFDQKINLFNANH